MAEAGHAVLVEVAENILRAVEDSTRMITVIVMSTTVNDQVRATALARPPVTPITTIVMLGAMQVHNEAVVVAETVERPGGLVVSDINVDVGGRARQAAPRVRVAIRA